MSEFKDRLGQDIEPGDTVCYATPTQDKSLKVGTVEDIVIKTIDIWDKSSGSWVVVKKAVPHLKITRPRTVWDRATQDYVERGTTAMYAPVDESDRFIVITELVKKNG